jgi:hypothetical protein
MKFGSRIMRIADLVALFIAFVFLASFVGAAIVAGIRSAFRYMTIDGALYRAGLKDVGGYARFTSTDEQLAQAEMERKRQILEWESEKE